MHSDTIYTRTSKGILEIKNRTVKLPRDIGLVFLAVDGKATVADLESRSGMSGEKLHQTLDKLLADGYIKTVGGPAVGAGAARIGNEMDLDFASPEAVAKLNLDAATRARAESDANARAGEERRAALDARLREEAESRARALAEIRVEAEAEAKAKAVAAAQAASEERAKAESELQAATDPGSRTQAEARVRAAATAVARAEAEAKARAEAEERARALAEAKRTAQEQAREEAESRLKAADEAQALAAAEGKARAALEAQIEATRITSFAFPPANAPAPPTPQVVDLVELQQQTARFRETAEAERREREGAEPKFELEPRAQELQERVQAGRRAREEAQATNTAAASAKPATEIGEQASTKLPDLDIEAGVTRTAPLRPPPAVGPSGGLARAMTEAAARAGTPSESSAPVLAIDDEPSKERVNLERAAQDILADAAGARERAAAAMQSRAAQRKREMEEDARREAFVERMQHRRAVIRNAAVTVVVLLAGLVGFLQFVSLTSFIPGAQQKLSARLNEPVTIARLRYALLPTPRLIIEGILIGKARPVKIDALTVRTLPFALLGDTAVFDTVEGNGVTIDPDMLGAIPAWAVTPSATGVQMKRLLLSGVQVQPVRREFGAFDADISFASNGTVRTATLKNEKVTLGLVSLQSQVHLSLSARAWRPPIGPAVEFTYLDFSGSANNTRLVVNDLQARVAGGALNATITARWDGPLTVEGELKTENMRLQEVMPAFTNLFRAAGLLQVNGRYALRSDTLDGLFVAPRIDATFSIARGELKEIDLVRTIQASSGTAFSGGRTPFDELSGTVQIAGGRYSYGQLQLSSGPLTASGAVDVAPGGELSGKLSAEVGAKGRVVARKTFSLAGTLQNPVLKR